MRLLTTSRPASRSELPPADRPTTIEFRRIGSLPPYVFTIIETLKIEARRAGEDVIDLGFGNPDLPGGLSSTYPGRWSGGRFAG